MQQETETKKEKKVALIGSAKSTLDLVPWRDKDIEMWCLAWRSYVRAERLFDLHTRNFYNEQRKNVPLNYEDQLRNSGLPVYLPKKHPDIPNSIAYPLDEVINFLGRGLDPLWHGRYFVCTVSYMIALAIYEGYDEIHLYGLDFVADGEYEWQKPNIEYLLGIARGMGKKVYVPPGSALLEFSHLYGFEKKPDPGFINTRILQDRIKQYEEKRRSAEAMLRTADGALQEAKQLIQLIHHQQRGGYVYADEIKHFDPDMIWDEALRREKEKENDGREGQDSNDN